MDDATPRTDAEPMAFTRTEFLRGALAAWLWFLALAHAAWIVVLGPYVLIATASIVPWSLGAAAAFGMPALLLGRALRTVHRLRAHVCAFVVLGIVIAVSTTGILFALDGHLQDTMGAAVLGINVVAAAVAVPLGWWHTVRRALRADIGGAARSDPDAVAEDESVEPNTAAGSG